MTTLSTRGRTSRKIWTVADLYRRFGPIPFERIRQNPPPGSGTVDDVVRLNDHEDRLYELVDGILVEKTVGLEESIIAGYILTILNNFVLPRGLGLVAGEAGAIQLDCQSSSDPRRVVLLVGARARRQDPRRADSAARPRSGRRGHQPEQHPQGDGGKAPGIFRARAYAWSGTCGRSSRVVDVYTAPDHFTRLTASMRLDGGDVLPGFSVQVSELFEMPKRPAAKGEQKKNGPHPGKKNGRRRGR